MRRRSEFWSFLPFVGDEGDHTYAAWAVAQEVHTSDEIKLANPPADDQPHAGVLYVDLTAARARCSGTGRSVDSKPFVGMATIGLAARRSDLVFFLGRTSVTRTFDGQRRRADFGTASLSRHF